MPQELNVADLKSPVRPPSTTTTVGPELVITPKSLRLSKAGWATLKVKCPTGEKRCKVTMRLKLSGKIVAKQMVTILCGKSMKVSLKVSPLARAKVAKRGSLKVTAVATATDAAGNVKITRTRITLRRNGRTWLTADEIVPVMNRAGVRPFMSRRVAAGTFPA
jgi:hypothetical protein